MKKMILSTTHLLIIAALVSLPSHGGASRTCENVLEDTAITAAVKSKFCDDIQFGMRRSINVRTRSRVVNLAGEVRSHQEKAWASEIAGSVEGVLRVNNKLRIDPTVEPEW